MNPAWISVGLEMGCYSVQYFPAFGAVQFLPPDSIPDHLYAATYTLPLFWRLHLAAQA